MAGLQRLRYHVADDPDEQGASREAVTFRGQGGHDDVATSSFSSDEDAARYFLKQLLFRDERTVMRSVAAPDEGPDVPQLAFTGTRDLPATSSRIVHFAQYYQEIPVFGAEALIELDNQRALISADAQVADLSDVGTAPTIEPAEAIQHVERYTDADLSVTALPQPTLEFFHETTTDRWHLTWHIREVPALPHEARVDVANARSSHGIGAHFRASRERADYLVDAHTGEVLYYFGTIPTIAIPSKCEGLDEDGDLVEFYGAKVSEGFSLHDPLRRVRTFDLELCDIDDVTAPADPVANWSATFGDEYRAAVTAHRHGALVQDFYKRILQRDGIDDHGMELESIVNCSRAEDQPPPEWINACWWNKRMWYGQTRDGSGRLVSLARFLDIIAHELTHGVIESSADLVYRDQSGALNESFADTFGVIIANWYRAPEPENIRTWDWRIGAGLGTHDAPLRDFADPSSLGDPAHMDDYLWTKQDLGGVHANSNIHNKAIHGMLTSVAPGGDTVLSAEEWTVILYMALLHLPRIARFEDARQKTIDVVRVYLAGDPRRMTAAEAAVAAAYDSVGID
jgi:bacillolysin